MKTIKDQSKIDGLEISTQVFSRDETETIINIDESTFSIYTNRHYHIAKLLKKLNYPDSEFDYAIVDKNKIAAISLTFPNSHLKVSIRESPRKSNLVTVTLS